MSNLKIDKEPSREREFNDFYELTEKDFYPIADDRLYISCVDDIDHGDNFEDYAKWFYDQYEEDIFEIETVC